jgi:hypothetical protein
MPTDPLRAAVLLAVLACITGFVLVAREPAPLVARHKVSRPAAAHAVQAALVKPPIQQLTGIVQYIDADIGVLIIRAAGVTYGIHLGASSVVTTPCVAPASLQPGQSVTVTVNAYLNGMLNSLELAPAVGSPSPHCASR